MATPMMVYADIASRFGVNSDDVEAVNNFFSITLPTLSEDMQREILEELLARDGEIPPRDKTEKMRVLLVSTHTAHTNPLNPREEARVISQALETSKQAEHIEMIFLSMSSADELQRALLVTRPDIIHFSGHASDNGHFLFDQSTEPPEAKTIMELLRNQEVKVCILNACHRGILTEPMAQITVNIEAALEDRAALAFSQAFYSSLGNKVPIEDAVSAGKHAAALSSSKSPLPIQVNVRPSR